MWEDTPSNAPCLLRLALVQTVYYYSTEATQALFQCPTLAG